MADETYNSKVRVPLYDRYNKQVDLRTILKLPEVKAQVAEGDISVDDLESVWLEACAVKVGRLLS